MQDRGVQASSSAAAKEDRLVGLLEMPFESPSMLHVFCLSFLLLKQEGTRQIQSQLL
jgi:hypothetical protein